MKKEEILQINCSLNKMSNVTRIFIPSYLCNSKGYFAGYVCKDNLSTVTIFLSKFNSKEDLLTEKSANTPHSIYGYCGNNVSKKKFLKLQNYIMFNKDRTAINQLVINGQSKTTRNIILMHYDYKKIRDSQTITDTADSISKLQSLILEENGMSQQLTLATSSLEMPHWLSSSMFLQHICNYLNLVKWLMVTVKKDKKISIKQGNLVLAVMTDIVLGYFLLKFVTQDTRYVSTQLMEVLEKLINMLYSLLTWLMGAPVGLKLNNAFNKMLGKYFSYHVQLWWLFLDTCSTKLDMILDVYHYVGFLGFTFQIAVISDMICLATFHSYCIYVYAARLFNIQISGLIALLRLFVGRKYNPLRGGIDSCEYTNQELFVGTVAFTILLLLLPTTAMYYIVFTVFRVLSLAVQHILAKLIYMVQTLPLYVGTLWLTNSSKVAGNILIEVEQDEESSPLILRVKLFSKSLFELIKNFKPPVEVPKQVEWTNLISNILKGKQIL